MNDLLGALLGGSQGGAQGDADGQDDNPMNDMVGDLLGSVLGGGGQASGAAGLLGGLLGGGGSQGGLGGLLGGLLGGGSKGGAGEMNPLMAPLANMLADKLGLSPQMAQMVMGFVLGKMNDAPNPNQAGTRGAAPQSGGLNLDNLLEQMNQGGVDKNFVQSQGLDKELAEQTGMDREQAAQSLEQVLNIFGGQIAKKAGAAPAQPKASGMEDLLDQWK
jgi:hypothetical protein